MANNRRRLTGKVVSNKMDKTVVVQIERTFRHRLYGKVIRDFERYMAHDENNECQIGDTVVMVESRPISRHKRWVVQDILREDVSARAVEVEEVAAVSGEEEAAQEDEAQLETSTGQGF
jgi:small subunit ribosomal protein S17